MSYANNGLKIAALALLLGAGSLFAACSSDNNNPGPSNNGTGGKSGTGGSADKDGGDSSGGKATGTGGKTGGTGGTEAMDGGSGGAAPGTGGADAGPCTEDNSTECLECPTVPTTMPEFLNHCGPGTAGCIKFTTTSTIPNPLPALP